MISESCRGNYRGNVRARHQTITHHPLLHPAVEAFVIFIVIAIVIAIIIVIANFACHRHFAACSGQLKPMSDAESSSYRAERGNQ